MSIIIQKMQELKGTDKHKKIELWDKWNHEKLKAKLEEIGTTAFNRSYRQIALSEEDKTFRYFNKILKDFDITFELTKSRYVHNENTLQKAINMLDSNKSVTQGVTVKGFE